MINVNRVPIGSNHEFRFKVTFAGVSETLCLVSRDEQRYLNLGFYSFKKLPRNYLFILERSRLVNNK